MGSTTGSRHFVDTVTPTLPRPSLSYTVYPTPPTKQLSMRGPTALFLSSVWTSFFAASRFHHVAATYPGPNPSPFYPQGFSFDWNPPGTPIPIPITRSTEQCETLAITWQPVSTENGPKPAPPYFLQIFTSAHTVPLIVSAGYGPSFDFQVPFNPGTQYQICMVDTFGVSGGCQDIYTVIPNTTATGQNPVTCTNVTVSPLSLVVEATTATGLLTEYGWIPQCTDIKVQAMDGTGPYTLTVAPTLHPPLNITSNGPINWTVSFTHGFPFFISLTDSQGVSWSQGPLHSGDNADTSCLDTNHVGHKSTTVPAAIGTGVFCIVAGLLAGAFGLPAFRRYRDSRSHKVDRADLMCDSQLSSNSQQTREMPATDATVNTAGGGGLGYYVEPFAMPIADPSSPPSDSSAPFLHGGVTSPTCTDAMSTSDSIEPPGRATPSRNVYVVRYDGGRAPVTVYGDEGAEVVELPSRYLAGTAGSTSTPLETRSVSSRETDVNRRR